MVGHPLISTWNLAFAKKLITLIQQFMDTPLREPDGEVGTKLHMRTLCREERRSLTSDSTQLMIRT